MVSAVSASRSILIALRSFRFTTRTPVLEPEFDCPPTAPGQVGVGERLAADLAKRCHRFFVQMKRD